MKAIVVARIGSACLGALVVGGCKARDAESRAGQSSAAVLASAAPSAVPSGPCAEGMVAVPAGTFVMGDGDNTERAGRVSVAPFCLDATEVTVSAYADCVGRGKCSPSRSGGACNGDRTDRADHPINCVDWSQADTYCTTIGKRLPAEEEWEYAARGADGRLFPWGNAAPLHQLCWQGSAPGGAARTTTCPVGSFRSGDSPFGVHDLAGNVIEWTASRLASDGPDFVARGGAWNDDDGAYVRAAPRDWIEPSTRNENLGFRCASAIAN